MSYRWPNYKLRDGILYERGRRAQFFECPPKFETVEDAEAWLAEREYRTCNRAKRA